MLVNMEIWLREILNSLEHIKVVSIKKLRAYCIKYALCLNCMPSSNMIEYIYKYDSFTKRKLKQLKAH